MSIYNYNVHIYIYIYTYIYIRIYNLYIYMYCYITVCNKSYHGQYFTNKEIPRNPLVRPHSNNRSKQYDILITRGSMKTLAICSVSDF